MHEQLLAKRPNPMQQHPQQRQIKISGVLVPVLDFSLSLIFVLRF
jgi:hypothetical protein